MYFLTRLSSHSLTFSHVSRAIRVLLNTWAYAFNGCNLPAKVSEYMGGVAAQNIGIYAKCIREIVRMETHLDPAASPAWRAWLA